MKRRSSVSVGRAQSSESTATTHLGTAAANLVTLVTATSPTPPGAVAPLAFTLRADGGPAPFTLRKGTVLVVTDVSVTIPRSTAPAGRYVAALCSTPCANSRVSIQVDTAADGFQKTLAFSGGVVFSNQPQFEPLASNPSDMPVLVYGYFAQRK